jgi:hypothetical protein
MPVVKIVTCWLLTQFISGSEVYFIVLHSQQTLFYVLTFIYHAPFCDHLAYELHTVALWSTRSLNNCSL